MNKNTSSPTQPIESPKRCIIHLQTPLLTPLPLRFPLQLLPSPRLPLLHQLKNPQIQRNPLPQPRRALRMIPLLLLIRRIRMDQRAQRAPIDDQPRDEGAELRGREEVHFEHGDGVWADGFVEEGVDAEFGDWCC